PWRSLLAASAAPRSVPAAAFPTRRSSDLQPGDAVVVRAGGIIPVDGLVLEGEVTVNQASLTGESIPVPNRPGGAVYAGTVVEEGDRRSTRLNSSHVSTSYAVVCLKKNKTI